MTKKKWLESTEPQLMLKLLRGKVTDRQLRLVVCAFVRLAWDKLTPASRSALEVGERFADQGVSPHKLHAAHRIATGESERLAAEAEATMDPDQGSYDPDVDAAVRANAAEAARLALTPQLDLDTALESTRANYWALRYDWNGQDPDERQCTLLREIIGNPFAPIAIDQAWRTRSVLSLAQTAYNERIIPSGLLDPDRLAVLADALEDAGCTDAGILEHLRGREAHVRGCWCLDLLLGTK